MFFFSVIKLYADIRNGFVWNLCSRGILVDLTYHLTDLRNGFKDIQRLGVVKFYIILEETKEINVFKDGNLVLKLVPICFTNTNCKLDFVMIKR